MVIWASLRSAHILGALRALRVSKPQQLQKPSEKPTR